MAKKIVPLVNSQIKNAKPKEKEYNLFDGDGLFLRVRNNSKVWMFSYSAPYTKKRTKISFGMYPQVSLSDARRRRAEARDLLLNNIDPNDNRKKEADKIQDELSNTFGKFAEEYILLKRQTTKPSTHLKQEDRLRNYLLPAFGNLPITEMKPSVLRVVLDPLAKEGKLETVKRLCNLANGVMRLALLNGKIEFNPIERISFLYPAKTVKHNPALAPHELPLLIESIYKANITEITRNLTLWQLHTITRSNESAKAKWSEIDFRKMLWCIPGERMKMKRDHEIPLTPSMIGILREMEAYRSSDYIFPAARKKGAHACVEAVNRALKRMGFKDRTTAHGLRSLASTILNEQEFPSDVIEAALAHVDKNTVRSIYNRTTYLKRRREMMLWWSEHIESAGVASGVAIGVAIKAKQDWTRLNKIRQQNDDKTYKTRSWGGI